MTGRSLDADAFPPVGAYQNAQQQARYEAKLADDRKHAARLAARILMVGAHGCTGRSCRARAHWSDRGRLDAALDELGLTEAAPG